MDKCFNDQINLDKNQKKGIGLLSSFTENHNRQGSRPTFGWLVDFKHTTFILKISVLCNLNVFTFSGPIFATPKLL